jgi:hypothetical protein
MTYCHVVGYSTGTTDRPSPLGQKLKLPSAVNHVVAKEPLLDAVQVAAGQGVVVALHSMASSDVRTDANKTYVRTC